jgi:hypothetical protein
MRTRIRASVGVVALAFVASACNDPSAPAPGRGDANGPPGSQQSRMLRGIDREFVQLARVVPGFGGLSRAADGSSILYLRDPSQAAAAKQAVAARPRLLRGIDVGRIQVRAAKFDYIQLTDWRARVRESLDVPGLVFLDIDESNNHLRIGVEKGTSHDLIASEVAKLDVPADAFSVEDAEPIRLLATLRDRIRPTMGGIQIAFNSADLPPGFFFVCTLGFNARSARSSDTYLVTNSHCSGLQGGVQHTEIFQPTPLPANLIALEHLDPDYFTDGCVPHRRCRFSDAALARYLPGVDATVGVIARTTFRGLTAGSLTIDDQQPTFTIADRADFTIFGQTLDKIGRTTGWTVGTVVATCIDVFVLDTDIMQLCQDEMLSGNAGGDSGSPVFESQAPFTNDVTLYGIQWGGGTTSFGPIVVFSPLSNIESELGPLIVTAP